jgi:hypothetical protein
MLSISYVQVDIYIYIDGRGHHVLSWLRLHCILQSRQPPIMKVLSSTAVAALGMSDEFIDIK